MPTAEQLTGGHILAHIATWLRGAGLEHRADSKRANRTYAVTLSSISAMRNLSRPRRNKWDFAQNQVYIKPIKQILRKTPETPSLTGEVSPLEKPKPVPETARLESFDAVLLFPPTVSLDSPTRTLKEVVNHMRGLRERPEPALAHASAVLELVPTFDEADQAHVFARYSTQLFDGTPVAEASADRLRVEALALYGWAQDRAANGPTSREVQAWHECAAEMVNRYRPSAAPSHQRAA